MDAYRPLTRSWWVFLGVVVKLWWLYKKGVVVNQRYWYCTERLIYLVSVVGDNMTWQQMIILLYAVVESLVCPTACACD